jgi:hypothetical protein
MSVARCPQRISNNAVQAWNVTRLQASAKPEQAALSDKAALFPSAETDKVHTPRNWSNRPS